MLAHLRGEYLQDYVNRLSVASHSIRCTCLHKKQDRAAEPVLEIVHVPMDRLKSGSNFWAPADAVQE